jgi:DNA-binding transcriptional LysR family regulator
MDPARIDLNPLPIFLAVVEAGGFTAAAERLGLSKAKVSAAVARLEQQVGASLFTRTTRRVSLTETGRALHERCAQPLAAILDSLSEVHEGKQALAGTLRIACTSDHLAQGLATAVVEFMRLHPLVQIDLRASDHVVHPVETGIDLAFRVGWLRDSSQRAVRLGDFGQVVVASPRLPAAPGRGDRAPRTAGHPGLDRPEPAGRSADLDLRRAGRQQLHGAHAQPPAGGLGPGLAHAGGRRCRRRGAAFAGR